MRDRQNRTTPKLLPNQSLYQPVRLPINITRRLIQDHDLPPRLLLPRRKRRNLQHRSRETEDLLLALGERVIGHEGIETAGGEEGPEADFLEDRDDVGGGVEGGGVEVVVDGAAEDEWLLGDRDDALADDGAGDVGEVEAVD